MKLILLLFGLLSVARGDLFSFKTQPNDLTIAKSSSFSLSCEATNANGAVEYQWYHESTIPNTHMTSEYSGSDATSSTIEVAQAEDSHAGFYQCRVKSNDGQLYSEIAEVKLHYFNTLSVSSKQVTISSTADAVRTTLPCVIPDGSSNPAATVTWFKDDVEFSSVNGFVVHADTTLKVASLPDLSVTQNSLVLFNIKSDLAGTYVCKATVNSDKISTKTQTVTSYTVTVTQEFGETNYLSTSLLTNGGSVTAGESVTLCCGTIGYNNGEIPTYTWYATNGESNVVTDGITDNGRTMILNSVTASHSYTCRACVGESCQTDIVTASVTPSSDAIEFTQLPSQYYLYEDGTSEGPLTITCKTSLGEGNWMKDGDSVSFPIDSPSSSDSGYYQCYASNSDSWVMQSTQVVVTDTLSLDISVPSELEFESSTTGIITCTTSGYPTPSVTIYKTNVNNQKEDIGECYDSPASTTNCIRNSGNSYYITIDTNSLDSTGTYTCLATQTYRKNSGGYTIKQREASGDVAVVKDVDVYALSTDSAELTYGESATFTCKITGGRAPFKVEMKFENVDVYVWSNNADEMTVGTGVCTGDFDKTCKGTIPSVGYEHEGELSCIAYNTAKDAETKTDSESITTTVIRNVYVEITGNRFPVVGAHMTLTCNHHEKPFSFSESVTWTRDGDSIVPQSSTGTSDGANYHGTVVGVFENMSTDDEGEYKCVSEGTTSAGADVYVGKPDEGMAPSAPELTVPDGQVGSNMTLTCTSEGYPPPDITWTIYTDRQVDNTTTIDKEKYKSTSVIYWVPDTAGDSTITCKASNLNGTMSTEAVMTIITAEEAQKAKLEDSEVAAIIAASIIAGVILFICIAFIIICICKHRESRKHDKSADGTIVENPGADHENPYATVFSMKRNFFKNPFSHPEEKKEDVKVKKSHYAEIIGEVKNNKVADKPKDPDSKIDPDRIMLSPKVVDPSTSSSSRTSTTSSTTTTSTTSSSSSSSRSSSSGTGSLIDSTSKNISVNKV